jgi:ABC-type amino acid transport substrate-binding protein
MKQLKILTLLFIVLIFITACNTGNNNTETKKELTKYEKILKAGKIRVGYVNYPPSFIVNPDGSFSGIFFETMEEIGKNLGIKVDYAEEETWDGMIESIKTGRVDMVCTGIWPTTERGKFVDFATPLFYSVVKAYTYGGNNKFDNNLSKINSPNVTIATIDGEMSSIIADMDFPKAKRDMITQLTGVSQVLMEIKTKKADVAFVEPAIALEFAAKNPNTIKEVKGVKPLRVFPNSMMLPKREEDLKSTINIATQELINNGFVDKVIHKYEKFPNSYYSVQLPYVMPK